MPTPDRRAGRLEEEAILFDDRTGDADAEDVRSMRYKDDAFSLVDVGGAFNPRLVDRNDHGAIDSLVHNVAETSTRVVIRVGGKASTIIVWNAAKTVKIRETTITREAGKVSQVVEQQFDAVGAIVHTLTSTYIRVGGSVTEIVTVKT